MHDFPEALTMAMYGMTPMQDNTRKIYTEDFGEILFVYLVNSLHPFS